MAKKSDKHVPQCAVCGKWLRPGGPLGYFCSEECDVTELLSRGAQWVVNGLRDAAYLLQGELR